MKGVVTGGRLKGVVTGGMLMGVVTAQRLKGVVTGRRLFLKLSPIHNRLCVSATDAAVIVMSKLDFLVTLGDAYH